MRKHYHLRGQQLSSAQWRKFISSPYPCQNCGGREMACGIIQWRTLGWYCHLLPHADIDSRGLSQFGTLGKLKMSKMYLFLLIFNLPSAFVCLQNKFVDKQKLFFYLFYVSLSPLLRCYSPLLLRCFIIFCLLQKTKNVIIVLT